MMSPIILLTGLLVFCRALPTHHHRAKDVAIERLSKVFGLPSAGATQTPLPDPPQYMLDLYNSVADHNGITRSSNPYNATIIRSFVNKGTVNSGVLFFNISGVEPNEAILHAELRLFRHRQKGIYVVEIYQISDLHQPADQNRLLVTKYIDAGDSAWETFNIHAAVVDWVSGESANLGLLVVTTSLQGDRSRLFRDGPLSVGDRAPILVLFSNSPSLASTPSYKQELSMNSRGDVPTAEYDYRRNVVDRKKRSSGPERQCSLIDMYVNFDDIGWSSWIISPKGYNAYACHGRCSFPLGQNQRPTNHATVQSIVSQMNLVNVGQPCCVPNRLLSLSLLYYDDYDNVILKQYEDMVADGCGCL